MSACKVKVRPLARNRRILYCGSFGRLPSMGASLCKVNCCKEGLQRALQPIRIDYLSEFYLQPIIIGYLSEFLLLIATFNTSDNPATFWRDTPMAHSIGLRYLLRCLLVVILGIMHIPEET